MESVFSKFSTNNEMDGRQYQKIMKDSGLLDKKLTTTDLDIIFAKVKAKGARKINLSEFEKSLVFVAEKKGLSVDDLKSKLSSITGPVLTGTKAEYNKFHDDKSLYTGVYAKGGPTNVDVGKGNISDISQLCDRTKADVRGVKK